MYGHVATTWIPTSSLFVANVRWGIRYRMDLTSSLLAHRFRPVPFFFADVCRCMLYHIESDQLSLFLMYVETSFFGGLMYVGVFAIAWIPISSLFFSAK